MSLHLLSFRPDFGRLARLAARERLLPPGDDAGYAVHAVFAASFGDRAPKPFQLFAPGEPGGGPSGRLLAYSSASLEDLRAHAAAFSDPTFSGVLNLDEAEAKVMPHDFAPGTPLGFRVRIRPVRRTGRSRDGQTAAKERDIYSGAREGEAASATRGDLYGRWLKKQFARSTAAEVETYQIETLLQTRLMTRNQGERRSVSILVGPDATFSGVLRVKDSSAFAELLRRGIGRFRAFGFGMLLLKPP
ncbi:MAG: type I-E CRISPR-associated protein Cas6/Cse3/CasE [Methylocystis sp.]